MNPNQISMIEHLPGETFALTADELEQLFESVIRVAGRMLLPTTLHFGIGRYTEISSLLRAMARYPGQIVLYGVPDIILPNYSNLKFIHVTEESPLYRERFILVYSTIWQLLAVAAPEAGVFRCALTQESDALEAATARLGAVLERGASYDSHDDLTARLLWSIAVTSPDAVRVARGLGSLGAPLAVASALYQHGEWRAAAHALSHILSASSVGMFRLDTDILSPVVTLGLPRSVALDTETVLTRAALTREQVTGHENGLYVAAFPMLQGSQVWGAVEVRREAAWDEAAQRHLSLMAALIGIALNEQRIAPPESELISAPTNPPLDEAEAIVWEEGSAFNDEHWDESSRSLGTQRESTPDADPRSTVPSTADNTIPSADETVEWPALDAPPASPLLEMLFEDPPSSGFEEVLDVFSFSGDNQSSPSDWETPDQSEDTEADLDANFTSAPTSSVNADPEAETILRDLDAFARQVSEMRRPETPAEIDPRFWLNAEDPFLVERRTVENQAAMEQAVREQIERHLAAAQAAREQIEAQLAEQEADRYLLQEQLAAEQQLTEEVQAELEEAQAARAEREAELARTRDLMEGLESAIAIQHSARVALERELAREQEARTQIEAQLAAERADLETLLADAPNLRLQLEQQLEAEYQARTELEAQIAGEQVATAELEAELDAQRAARQRAEQTLALEQDARVEAEYAAVAEVVATDGLPSGSFLRDMRLFVTRLRERVSRLKAEGSAQSRLVEQVVNEASTAIEILSEIALIAQVDARKHIVADVSGLLQEVLGSLYQQAAQRQVQLRPGQMDITLSVRGDREALERALYNVVLSCVYMAVSGSSVGVTLGRRGAYADVRIVFRSTEELTDRLEAFMHHFDKGVPRRSALAMARTVILHHGGQLKGQVLDQECNTEIIVALPLGQAKEQEIDRYDEDLHTDR